MFQTNISNISVLFILLVSCECARILGVFPLPSISHQVVFRAITEELAKRNHELVILTTDPQFSNVNVTEVDLHDISYAVWDRELVAKLQGVAYNHVGFFEAAYKALYEIVDKQLALPEVKRIIDNKDETFDLVLMESYALPVLGFSHVFNAPVIVFSSFHSPVDICELLGVPLHPLLYPSILRTKLNKLSLLDKLTQLYQYSAVKYQMWKNLRIYDEIMKRGFGDDCPSVNELSKNIAMLFVNTHPIWENNKPLPPSVINLGGGIHMKTPGVLDEEMKTYLEQSQNGTIYMSLGTNVHPSQLPEQIQRMFLKVFSTLPYDVLLRWDTEIVDKPANIKVVRWVQQNELLRHPKIKLFVMQGGLQSTDEAIDAGVPVIGIPVLADQFYNTEKYEEYGIGIRLDFDTITEEKFRGAIETVIGNESYRKNVFRLRDIIKDQPQRPIERAIWWIEYVIRHKGAEHLRSSTWNVTWSEFLMLDVVAVIVFVLVISSLGIISLLNYFLKKIYKTLPMHRVKKMKMN